MKKGSAKKEKMKEINNQNIQTVKYAEIPSVQSSKSIESFFTPIFSPKPRAFLKGAHNQPMFISNSSNEQQSTPIKQISSSSQSETTSNQVYFGTNINFRDVQEHFENFIKNYRPKDDMNSVENYYLRMIKEIKDTKIFILNIDGEHIDEVDHMLYWQLINFPSEMIPIFDQVSNKIYLEVINNQKKEQDKQAPDSLIQVRITNLKKKSLIRELGPEDIDKLVSFSFLVVRTSEVIPEMREAYFRCSICSTDIINSIDRNFILEPTECPNCHAKSSFELIHNLSSFNDKQNIKVQEISDEMPEGQTPITVHLCAYDELVDYVKPGDRCQCVGIYRAQGIRVNPNQRVTKSTFRTYIDVISLTKYNKLKMNIDGENDSDEEDLYKNVKMNELSELYNEEITRQVEELKNSKDIYNILVESIAPNIWENDDVKKGLLLQLFGGVSKDFTVRGEGKIRGEINVLLIGDPSTAKSQLLQYIHSLSPRGIYTSGKGSSVVGLTAYVTKDIETKELILESGALVLSDKGICCIDEFDKMDDNTKVVLHEAMEQQTISIAKAGIICQLNTRTAILASANPIYSRYDPKLSVIQNIRLPPALLSRFDLIYLMIDKRNEADDRRLANHIISLYGNVEEEDMIENEDYNKQMEIDDQENIIQKKEEIKSSKKKSKKKEKKDIKMELEAIPQVKRNLTFVKKEVLTAYITQAKKLNPELSEEVITELIRIYVEMRKSNGGRNTISATPRQLESLIRLSEARARLRFSKVVEKEDVEEAVRLVKVATQQAATDPVTGVIDMDMISTGLASSSRKNILHLKDIIKNILRDNSDLARKGVKSSSIYEEVKKKVGELGRNTFTFSEFEYRDSLRFLEDEGFIAVLGSKRAPNIRLISVDI